MGEDMNAMQQQCNDSHNNWQWQQEENNGEAQIIVHK